MPSTQGLQWKTGPLGVSWLSTRPQLPWLVLPRRTVSGVSRSATARAPPLGAGMLWEKSEQGGSHPAGAAGGRLRALRREARRRLAGLRVCTRRSSGRSHGAAASACVLLLRPVMEPPLGTGEGALGFCGQLAASLLLLRCILTSTSCRRPVSPQGVQV